ncbi:MAG: O-antigen ligase family protein [Chloroflexi bacterium]|nr:O-antigen ligase family protein [Chloroflexota bacterium]MCC6895412.1 O-antigen ligase family protein [Anaerolineae bacterium]
MPKLRLSPVLLVMNSALIIYALTALISLRAAYNPALSEGTVAAVIGSVIAYFVVLVLLRRSGRYYVFAALIAILGAAFSLFFISQFKYQEYIETPDLLNRIGTMTSLAPDLDVFIHPNSAATVFELLLPVVVALMFMTRDWKKRGIWIVAALFMLYAFALTYSRGAYLGVVVALIVALVAYGIRRFTGRQMLIMIGGIIGVVVLGMAALFVLGTRVQFVASLLGVTNSRLEIYRNSLALAGDYPFTGIGLGDTFALMYSRYSLLIFVPLFTYTHNLLLAVLLGQGVVGLVAFVLVIITFYLFVLRVLWIVRVAQPSVLFYGACIGVTATLVHGLTDARQYVESPFNLPLLFLMMALAVSTGIYALREEAFEERGTNFVSGKRLIPLATAAVVVLMVVGYLAFNKPILAAWHTNLGAVDEARADTTMRPLMRPDDRAAYLANARSEYGQALAIDPDYPNANRRLGMMEVDAGNYDVGIPMLEKAYAAEPNYQAAIKGLGLAYVWVGRTQDAACLLATLPDTGEMLEELYNWQNFRHEQQQDLLSAYALETAAIMEDYSQTNMDVWALIGDRYRNGGKPEQAQVWYSRALAQMASHAGSLAGLMTLGLERVDVPEAVDCGKD